MDRRQFIRGMLAGGTVAIAAKMNVSEAVAEEIEEELTRDLGRTVIQVPGQVFVPPKDLWQSTARVRQAYTAYVGEKLRQTVDQDVYATLHREIPNTVSRLVSALDQDLSVNNLEHEKVILEMPDVSVRKPVGKRPELVLKAGIKQEVNALGHSKLISGYIKPEGIVDRWGKKIGLK